MIRSISGTIVTEDNEEVQFHMSGDTIQRWGASPATLAKTVDATEAAQLAITEAQEWI